MRLIAGRFRGRALASPRDRRVRPTTDRMRETLFNLLAHGLPLALDGARVADLYAGTGALGLEALSRGAVHVTFVENHPAALTLLNENIKTLGVTSEVRVMRTDAQRLPPAPAPFDLVFLDPPYGQNLVAPTIDSLEQAGWIDPGSIIVIECEESLTPAFEGLIPLKERIMGAARITIFEVEKT